MFFCFSFALSDWLLVLFSGLPFEPAGVCERDEDPRPFPVGFSLLPLGGLAPGAAFGFPADGSAGAALGFL